MLELPQDGDLPQCSLAVKCILEDVSELFDGHFLISFSVKSANDIAVRPFATDTQDLVSRTYIPVGEFDTKLDRGPSS